MLKVCRHYFRTSFFFNEKVVFLRILWSWLLFFLQHNPPWFPLYEFPSSGDIVFRQHSALQFSLFLNMCSILILLASHSYYKLFFLFFFVVYSQSSLSWIEYYFFIHTIFLSIIHNTKIMICNNFHLWGESAGKGGSGISSLLFPLDDFITWYQAYISGWFVTTQILMLLLLAMTSMIKQRLWNASSTIFIILSASKLLEISSNFFEHSCYSGSRYLLYS